MKTILNVDDNEPSRYVKSHILSHAGFTVYEAGTGKAALELLAQHNPDLILLDVNLPDVHGFEVCRQIKSTPSLASVIVLHISASATGAPQATAALDGGADAYLTEPVDPDVLVATVKALLRLRKAERELSSANERLQTVNRELQRSNEDLEQFAFAASHDLQEPLRTVTSFAGLLERSARNKLTGAELEYLNYITDGSHRMRALIDDLLRYSQIGQKPESTQTVDLDAVSGLGNRESSRGHRQIRSDYYVGSAAAGYRRRRTTRACVAEPGGKRAEICSTGGTACRALERRAERRVLANTSSRQRDRD